MGGGVDVMFDRGGAKEQMTETERGVTVSTVEEGVSFSGSSVREPPPRAS